MPDSDSYDYNGGRPQLAPVAVDPSGGAGQDVYYKDQPYNGPTSYGSPSSTGSAGGGAGGTAAPASGGRGFGRSSVFKGTDGHYYYQNADGSWVDSGATDAVTASQSIAAALGIGGGLAAYFIQQADVEAQQQGRAQNLGTQWKLMGVTNAGLYEVQRPDGSIATMGKTELDNAMNSGAVPGITVSDREQAEQESVYRQMRANTAAFQMGAMPDVYSFGTPPGGAPSMPGAPHGGGAPPGPPATYPPGTPGPPEGVAGPEPTPPPLIPGTGGGSWTADPNANSVGSSGAPNPYTGSTAGLTGKEASSAPAGGPMDMASMQTRRMSPPNGAATTMPGAAPVGALETPKTTTNTTMSTDGTASTTDTTTSGGGTGTTPPTTTGGTNVPYSAPGTSWGYADDGTVGGFERGNQVGSDILTREHNTYMLGSDDYTNGKNRAGWEDWYRDQTNRKNLAAMGRQNDISFDGNGNYSATDWMGKHISGYTPESLIASGSATATDLERARAAWLQWKTNQNMQNLAATSRNLSGMGFSAIGAPRIAGYG